MAKKAVSRQLDDASAARAAITTQRAQEQAARSAALIAGADVAEIAKIDAKITALDHAAKTEADRIELLKIELDKEQQANVATMQASRIARFAKLQAARVACAGKIQQDVSVLWKDVCELIELSDRARAGYSVHSQSAIVGANSIDGAAMRADAITKLLSYEFCRNSRVPFHGGKVGERTPPSLPGAANPRPLEWILTPEKIMPFADKIKAAADYAVTTLKAEIRAPGKNLRIVPVPAAMNGEPRPRTDAEARLAALLVQQAEAANDISPQGEQRYKSILAEIIATTAEIDTWQTETKPAEADHRPAA